MGIKLKNILIDIFAILDCDAFTFDEIKCIVLKISDGISHPREWLVQLSFASSISEGRSIVSIAMQEYGIMLPDDIGDIMAGLILMREKRGEIEDKVAQRALFDVVDAYGSAFINLEEIYKIEFSGENCDDLIGRAERLIEYLLSGEIDNDDAYFTTESK